MTKNKKYTPEEVQAHYDRLDNASDLIESHLTNWQEKYKLATRIASEANLERSRELKRGDYYYFSYGIAFSCLAYVFDHNITKEKEGKTIIYSIATDYGYTLENINWAYSKGCLNTKEYRYELLSKFKSHIDRLVRHTSLTKTSLNHKQANTLPKLLKLIIKANKELEDKRQMKEDNKRLEEDNSLLRARLLEVGDNTRKNMIEVAKCMAENNYTQKQIAKTLGVDERTIRRWLNGL